MVMVRLPDYWVSQRRTSKTTLVTKLPDLGMKPSSSFINCRSPTRYTVQRPQMTRQGHRTLKTTVIRNASGFESETSFTLYQLQMTDAEKKDNSNMV